MKQIFKKLLNEVAQLADLKILADKIGINWDKVEFSIEDLRQGIDVELEHGLKDKQTNITNDNPIETAKIALAHLKENPNYYKLLKKYVENN